MPTILELFKQANGNGDVTVWDGTTQKSGIVNKVKDFASAELNPNGPRMMFYKQLITPPLIYALDTPRISLKGAVDPARTLSVNSSKYQNTKSTSGKITIGSLLGGSANRPSDTIFENKTGTPVTKGTLGSGPGDYAALQNAVEPGKSYYVSQFPAGKSPFAGVLKGDLNTIGTNIAGAGISAGKNLIQKGISKVIKKSRNKINDPNSPPVDPDTEPPPVLATDSKFEYFKPKNFVDNHNNDSGNTEKKFTTHIRNSKGVLEERTAKQKIYSGNRSNIDTINSTILTSLSNRDNLLNDDLTNLYKNTNGLITSPYVLFRAHRESGFAGDNVLLPGTVSGITEDVSPEWSTFKFIGSPFNQYRYLGVERSISFEIKLYSTSFEETVSMKKSLNKLRKLVYPDENITAIQYPGDKDKKYSPIVFNGNLTRLTINGLYYNLLGFIESLSISIDDSTSWTSNDLQGNTNVYDGTFVTSLDSAIKTPSPSVINVSIGFKVINEVSVNSSDPANQKLQFKF